jgi:hypothetical protein
LSSAISVPFLSREIVFLELTIDIIRPCEMDNKGFLKKLLIIFIFHFVYFNLMNGLIQYINRCAAPIKIVDFAINIWKNGMKRRVFWAGQGAVRENQ